MKTYSLLDIAHLADTSKSTVSRVLNADPRVSNKVKDRVNKILKKTGYMPNMAARGLRKQDGGAVAVLAMYLQGHYIAKMLQGINSHLYQNNILPLTVFTQNSENYIQSFKSLQAQSFITGIILIAPPVSFFDTYITGIKKRLVFCSIGDLPKDNYWYRFSSVNSDSARIMSEIPLHKRFSRGNKLIYLHRSLHSMDDIERYKMMKKTAKKYSSLSFLSIDNEKVFEETLLPYIKKRKPSGIICCNDAYALKTAGIYHTHKLELPFISGCDGEPAMYDFNLVTIDVPLKQMSSKAAELVLQKTKSPADKVICSCGINI
jgi:DNA-binding LacI/PurR family transcriptional regulator